MKAYIQIIAVAIAGFFFGSCSDKMYVQAPCSLDNLNINTSIAQEINEMSGTYAEVTASLELTLNYGTGKNYSVQIYNADPALESSYILGYYMLDDESTTQLMCNLPEKMNDLYVSIVDHEGNKTVKQIAMINGSASATFGTLMASAK